MISMADRLRIQTLRKAGHTLEEVAGQVGVTQRSVETIVQDPPVTSLDAGPTRGRGGEGIAVAHGWVLRAGHVRRYRVQPWRYLRRTRALASSLLVTTPFSPS